jgi:superfamily I DNA/RNA helicase
VNTLEQQIKLWQRRMETKRAEELQEELTEAEKLQQEYLKRTGRKEMKP